MHYKLSKINIADPYEYQAFLENLSKIFPHDDIFETENNIDIKDHYHSDYESRLILEGNPTFYIYGEEVTVGPGTYIEILPEVIHSFKSTGYIKAIRFFSTNQSWKATFL